MDGTNKNGGGLKKKRKQFSDTDLRILSELINTMKDGKYKAAIENGLTRNDDRHKIWTAITDAFNMATGSELDVDKVRKKYHRIKQKERKEHDEGVLQRRNQYNERSRTSTALRTACSLTGSGPSPFIPQDVNGDEYVDNEDAIQPGRYDPTYNAYGVFNPPGSSRGNISSQRSRSEDSSGDEDIDMTGRGGGLPLENVGMILPANNLIPENAIIIASQEYEVSTVHAQAIPTGETGNWQGNSSGRAREPPTRATTSPNLANTTETRAFPTRDNIGRDPSRQGTPTPNLRTVEDTNENERIRLVTLDQNARATGSQQVTPLRAAPRAPPRRAKKTTTLKDKEAAATNFYRKSLKQRTSLNKLSANNLYMKGRILEKHLIDNDISYDLPFPQIDCNFDEDSDIDESDNDV